MPSIQAKKCVPVRSSWVRYFILTCDLRLAVQFYDGHHPHHPRVHHPKPDVCCFYPTSNETLFNIAVASDPGRFVHRYLYKKLPYLIVKPPCPAVNCVQVSCCTNGLPDTLTATLKDTGGCACLDGVQVALNWGISQWGSVVESVCGGNSLQIIVACRSGSTSPAGFVMQYRCSTATELSPFDADAGGSCSPLAVTFSNVQSSTIGGTPCCTGTVQVTITE